MNLSGWVMMQKFFGVLVVAGLVACSEQNTEPYYVYPEMEPPTTFTRAFSLTESPDGKLRLFAREDGDSTHLYESHKLENGDWSEPEQVTDLPYLETLSTPAFSPKDGKLYYSSDEPLELHKFRTEKNIWVAEREGGKWVNPQPLPPAINTGATETSPAVDADGRLYFVTNHSRAGGGGLDIMEAQQDQDGQWQVTTMPEGLNSRRADDHLAVTPDGNTLFFYSHRTPKLGNVDIWRSRRGEDGQWQEPENIGAPINSEAIDFGAGISGDGKSFYFSRDGALMAVSIEAALRD